MRTYSVIFSEQSENTLAAIYAHIAADSPENAEQFISMLTERTVNFLEASPQAGLLYKKNQRFITIGSYVVLYAVVGQRVIVLDIFPHGKNWRS